MAKHTKTQGNFMVIKDGMRVAAFADEGDKRLFDAAPDLLAAVKECRKLLIDIDDTEGLVDEDRLLLDQLNTVIAKATNQP